MRITILTVGSYGDVQPFVALGLGLRRAGYAVRLATHALFEEFIRSRGLDFAPLPGNPQEFLRGELGQAWQESSRKSIRLMRSDASFFEEMERGLDDSWRACQDAEAIIHAPLALAGPHVVEKLGVPGFLAAVYPSVRWTRAFPHPLTPSRPYMGGAYNWLTYVVADQISWLLFRRLINQFRRKTLRLPPRPFWSSLYSSLDNGNVSLLYGYSPAVLPHPTDWPERSHVTGYWFLDRPADWQPPPELVAFLEVGPKPIYIGFGSMVLRDPQELTRLVLEALARTGHRAILGMGWGGLSNAEAPDHVFKIESVPHDWLFPRVAAVVHHGGCGTIAASLRARIPMVVIPFFGDQFFWGQRVAQLGVGPAPIPRTQLTAERLAAALQAVTGDAGMRARAAALGERIRVEDGVARAVEVVDSLLAGDLSADTAAKWASGQHSEVSG